MLKSCHLSESLRRAPLLRTSTVNFLGFNVSLTMFEEVLTEAATGSSAYLTDSNALQFSTFVSHPFTKESPVDPDSIGAWIDISQRHKFCSMLNCSDYHGGCNKNQQ